jgi:hypothetical protein
VANEHFERHSQRRARATAWPWLVADSRQSEKTIKVASAFPQPNFLLLEREMIARLAKSV